jgi:hypothetical protein
MIHFFNQSGAIRMWNDEKLTFRLFYLFGAIVVIGGLSLGVFCLIVTHFVNIIRNVTTNEVFLQSSHIQIKQNEIQTIKMCCFVDEKL